MKEHLIKITLPMAAVAFMFGVMYGSAEEHGRMKNQQELTSKVDHQTIDICMEANKRWEELSRKADLLTEQYAVDLVRCRAGQ